MRGVDQRMAERLGFEARLRRDLGVGVLRAFEGHPGEAGQGLELAYHFKPGTRVPPGAHSPRFERDGAVQVPEKRGADEEAPDLVVARFEERQDALEARHLARRLGAARTQ